MSYICFIFYVKYIFKNMKDKFEILIHVITYYAKCHIKVGYLLKYTEYKISQKKKRSILILSLPNVVEECLWVQFNFLYTAWPCSNFDNYNRIPTGSNKRNNKYYFTKLFSIKPGGMYRGKMSVKHSSKPEK